MAHTETGYHSISSECRVQDKDRQQFSDESLNEEFWPMEERLSFFAKNTV